MVIGPAAAVAAYHLPRRHARRLGLLLAVGGIGGLLALVGWAALTWEPGYGPLTARLFGLRVVYLVATQTALPVVQCALVGGVLLFVRRS